MSSTAKKLSLILLLVIAGAAVYFVFFKSPVQENSPVAGTAAAGSPGAETPAEGTPSQESVYLPLTDLTGKEVTMDENKIAFVNVWATWCGPCNMEMPGIQTLYNKYKDHNKVAFYIISDEDAETVNPFIARKGYQLPFYQYAGPYPSQLDGNAIPRTYIIYKGKILAEEIGASQWDRPEVIELIEKQLAEI
ncbi:Thiol-disulfide isomerase or thioredoxin [Dyadobacter soli]|uniref:Thiol-disulfide isomerase or thioredoxin n=1 Tax=Dyadobacter soli TaxID=659014 RepID=A0A1G7BFQ7_9BACT|nr:TlpA disulfide reductase family protein [Dyadobacter soli]SDE25600.1 Thiol-disulfide isomerase or thioredoxin [Dyadobacter soli]